MTWPRLNLTFIWGFVLSTTDKTGFAHGRKPRAPSTILKLFGLSLYFLFFIFNLILNHTHMIKS
ncbi:hypothetical protein D8T58_20465 [Vibrio vulnificus]|nr:hypothetical protein D8T58_20465 [Vibrio vulnificus]